MGKRRHGSSDDPSAPAAPVDGTHKRRKTDTTTSPSNVAVNVNEDDNRPKSRKALRAERKAALRAAKPKSAEEIKAERKRQAQQQKKQQEKEQIKELIKQERQEKKLRKQQKIEERKSKKKAAATTTIDKPDEEEDMALRLVQEIKYGRTDASSGMTTLPMGVQYKDLVVGQGPTVHAKSLVTVKYRLTGGKSGALVDSNNKFTFRLGKGEVIQGWDVGLRGMRQGGRRQLVVPPKAGYGSQDIGAGPGAVLHFDITLLAVRES